MDSWPHRMLGKLQGMGGQQDILMKGVRRQTLAAQLRAADPAHLPFCWGASGALSALPCCAGAGPAEGACEAVPCKGPPLLPDCSAAAGMFPPCRITTHLKRHSDPPARHPIVGLAPQTQQQTPGLING